MAQPGQLADTFGWDTVYAIKYADVNTAIGNDWPSPPIHINQVSGPASIDGDFVPWQVTTGGSGHLVHMSARVPALAYVASGSGTCDATAEIEVELEFVPQPPAAGQARGTGWHDLRLKSASAPVTVLDVTYSSSPPTPVDQAIIKDLFRIWFNDPANLQNFNTVFASVNLNAKADVDAFQWLSPTHVSYAVAEEASLPDGIFAVLCMTENRDPTGLGHQVSPYAIPANQRSAFLLSRERYLSKLLLPGIGMMFSAPAGGSKRWPEEYFELGADGASITNTDSIRIAQLQIDEKNTREATIAAGDFVVRLLDTKLAIDITNMKHDYTAGLAWLNVNHTIRTTSTAALRQGHKFALDPGDGSHTIVVTKDPAAEWVEIGLTTVTLLLMTTGMALGAYRTVRVGAAVEGGNTLTQTVELTEVTTVPDAAAAPEAAAGASGCLATVRGGATATGRFLGSLWQNYRATAFAAMSTATGIPIVIMKMLEFIAKVDSQHYLPDFKEFSAGVMAPVQWPKTQSQFDVKAVAFNGSFQAAGDPGFAD